MIIHSDTAPRCAVHLGMPKTATSLLQFNLFARHSQIEYLGKFGRPKPWRRPAGDQLQKLLKNLPDASTKHCKDHLVQPLERARQTGNVVLFSAEGMTGGSAECHRRRAEQIRDQLGNCRILFTLRHPLHFVESMYFQKLKSSAIVKEDFPRVFGKYLGNAPCYFEIREFLEANQEMSGSGILSHLEVAASARVYADVFGPKNIRFFFQEELARNPQEFAGGVCEFFGVDATEGCDLVGGRWRNDRLTTAHIKRIRRISSSGLLAALIRRAPLTIRQRALHFALPPNPPARGEIPTDWRERILERVRSNNRQLVNDWGLPLERYGYPL